MVFIVISSIIFALLGGVCLSRNKRILIYLLTYLLNYISLSYWSCIEKLHVTWLVVGQLVWSKGLCYNRDRQLWIDHLERYTRSTIRVRLIRSSRCGMLHAGPTGDIIMGYVCSSDCLSVYY